MITIKKNHDTVYTQKTNVHSNNMYTYVLV